MAPRLALMFWLVLLASLPLSPGLLGQSPKTAAWPDLPPTLRPYFERRVDELSSEPWQDGITPESWPSVQAEMRPKLRDMLGLNPWPERSPLRPTLTGTTEGDGYTVERLHFQSMPGVYVGANFYLPREQNEPLPTILYVCGHSNKTVDGIRYGNKTGYQHHGVWFARHGYACLIIDTVQLGEIPGEHHGTYRLGQWWWASRGYTPAGIEAWNGIRALDYLETRSEVDATRIGMTGRSGGGAYTWWVAALDDRVKAAVPVAGITTLKNHILDGCIEGHCDCMFMVNTERWDFDRVAALVAPRPLLISNTDKDNIFPLDGVVEIYNKTRRLYKTLGHENAIGLHLAEGPHKDTQPLNTGAFHWMERHLKGADPMDLTEEPARPAHQLSELKVFETIPVDERVTKLPEFFVPEAAPPETPTKETWPALRDRWKDALRTQCFRAWPDLSTEPKVEVTGFFRGRTAPPYDVELVLTRYQIETEPGIVTYLDAVTPVGETPENARDDEAPKDPGSEPSEQPEAMRSPIAILSVSESHWSKHKAGLASMFPEAFPAEKVDPEAQHGFARSMEFFGWTMLFNYPRGVGPSGWGDLPEEKQRHIRRRFLLLGESLEGGQVWDIRQSAIAVTQRPRFRDNRVTLWGLEEMAVHALYASLFTPQVSELSLLALPTSHRHGAHYLSVQKHLDIPDAVVLATDTARLYIGSAEKSLEPWQRTLQAIRSLERDDLIQIDLPRTLDEMAEDLLRPKN